MFEELRRLWRRDPQTPDPELAIAGEKLDDLEARADRVVPRLRDEQRRNHFAERLRHTFVVPPHRGAGS